MILTGSFLADRYSSRLVAVFILIVGLCLFTCPAQAESNEERARRVLAEIDDLWRASSSVGVMTMRVKTAHYTRTITMKTWSKGKEKSLVRILTPKKEKGTASLKSGNSLYTYLPKTDRTIRLTSGMMMGSWMGSHFTNDDLVKESRLSDDYVPSITFEGERDGETIMEFTLLAKPDAPVVWGKIEITVRAADTIPLSARYYDDDMILGRTMIYGKVEEMGGRMIPTVLRIQPTDKPAEFTELVYKEMQFDLEIKDSFFSLLQLRRK